MQDSITNNVNSNMMMIRRALAGIDYTSPVCKINIAVNKIPNFLADPNTTEQAVMITLKTLI